jgi:hypothetical protein
MMAGKRGSGEAWQLVLILGSLFLASCSSGRKTSTGRTQREADSVLGQSTVPGAPVVKKAMAAQDTARAQAAAVDTAAAAE